jgi:hypothetical protein
MRHLYWSCHPRELHAMLRHLRELGQEGASVGIANGLQVIHVSDPNDHILDQTPSLIAEERLRSAALVAAPLSSHRLFVAAEWWRCFVFDTSQARTAERLSPRIRRVTDNKELDLVIFEVRRIDFNDIADKPDISLGEIAATPISEAEVRANPEAYFGGFVSPTVGGANVLFAAGQEAAEIRGLGSGVVLVGNPETFGFTLDQGERSIVSWLRQGTIKIDAFGFALRDWQGVVGKLDIFQDSSSNISSATRQIEHWIHSDIAFGLALTLYGLDDPPVVIPMGSVYQQPVMGSRIQNLAVAQSGTYNVSENDTVPLVLPAWCLNPTFSPPNGPMMPTALLSVDVAGSQRTIWNSVRRRYMGNR